MGEPSLAASPASGRRRGRAAVGGCRGQPRDLCSKITALEIRRPEQRSFTQAARLSLVTVPLVAVFAAGETAPCHDRVAAPADLGHDLRHDVRARPNLRAARACRIRVCTRGPTLAAPHSRGPEGVRRRRLSQRAAASDCGEELAALPAAATHTRRAACVSVLSGLFSPSGPAPLPRQLVLNYADG